MTGYGKVLALVVLAWVGIWTLIGTLFEHFFDSRLPLPGAIEKSLLLAIGSLVLSYGLYLVNEYIQRRY
jgi:hypothetical protein